MVWKDLPPEQRRKEVVAGVTTFFAMSYIIIINPIILTAAGMPLGPVMVATIITAALATIASGIFTDRPFCMAPYMGENAFFAYTVVIALGVTWNAALGAVFVAGILFLALSFSGWRSKLVDSIPPFLSATWAVAIGLFLIFIAFANIGISLPGSPGAPVKIGNMVSPEALLAMFGIGLTLFLYLRKVVGALPIGMLVILVLGFVMGALNIGTSFPQHMPDLFGPIPDWSQVLFKLDVGGALNATLLPIIVVMFLMAFFDTTGTMMGLGMKAGFLDDKGHLPNAEKVMQVDAAATAISGVVGTTTTGVFIESATGIEHGGRTGLTAVVAGLLFLCMLAFTSFFSGLSAEFLEIVAAPAIVVVGVSMFSQVERVDMKDMAQVVPMVFTIGFMLFTFNIGFGLAIGLVAYPLTMICLGRRNELPKLMYLLMALGLLLFLVYPY